jgi:hypothetical protein
LATLLLTVAAIFVPRPGELSEPVESAQILEPEMFFTREGGTYRFITWDQTPKFTSVYKVMKATIVNQSTTRKIGWDNEGLSLGFFHQKGSWMPRLEPQPIGEDAGNTASRSVNGVITWMEQSEIDTVLPLVVRELDKREARRGARFQEMLRDGVVMDSIICWQNGVVLVAWLSLPLAVLAMIWGLREIFVACIGALGALLAIVNGALESLWQTNNLDRAAIPLTIIAAVDVFILLMFHHFERPAGFRASAPVRCRGARGSSRRFRAGTTGTARGSRSSFSRSRWFTSSRAVKSPHACAPSPCWRADLSHSPLFFFAQNGRPK